MSVGITGLSHAGVRVRELDRAVAFYGHLGFTRTSWFEAPRVAILRHPCGLELNLIVNADQDGPNVLMDVPSKHAGWTHVALEVGSLDEAQAALSRAGIPISEGPVTFPTGGSSIFCRDPDGNVVELHEAPPGDVVGVPTSSRPTSGGGSPGSAAPPASRTSSPSRTTSVG